MVSIGLAAALVSPVMMTGCVGSVSTSYRVYDPSLSVDSVLSPKPEVLKSLATNSEMHAALSYNQDGIWASSRDPSYPGTSLKQMVEFSHTPFAQQVQIPIVSLLGGRLSLSGLKTVTSTENIERGLPGSGSFAALSIARMGQAGVREASDHSRYGLGLSLHP